jgi:hypothetical protein
MATQEPPIRFSTFVISLASSGLAHLGQGGGPTDPALAKQTLDLLQVLADKTRGNLDEEEARLLDALRKELSDKYAAVTRAGG